MDSCPSVPSNPAHKAAMHAHASLSRTQFGQAALERHGHQPMSIETAEAYMKQKGAVADGQG